MAVENAWTEYNHTRLLTSGSGSSSLRIPVAEPLPEPYAFDRAAHLPPRAVPGRTDRRDSPGFSPARAWERLIRGRLPVLRCQQQLRRQQPGSTCGTARRGAHAASSGFRLQGHCGASMWLPTSTADRWGLTTSELAEDNVFGFEGSARAVDAFSFRRKWARGTSLQQTRSGFLPAAGVPRIDEDWIAFYRAEQLSSPRIRARRAAPHPAGLNYRPYSADRVLQGRVVSDCSPSSASSFTRRRGTEAVQRLCCRRGLLLLMSR